MFDFQSIDRSGQNVCVAPFTKKKTKKKQTHIIVNKILSLFQFKSKTYTKTHIAVQKDNDPIPEDLC